MAKLNTEELLNENEMLKAQVYNLQLYLNDLLSVLTQTKEYMMREFDGMPGFVEQEA